MKNEKINGAIFSPSQLSGEEGWTFFDAGSLIDGSLRFVSGDTSGNRYRINYYKDNVGHLCARIWLGPGTEGPRGYSHGGAVAAVLDEVLSLAACAKGFSVVMGKISIRFCHMVPLECVMTVESRVLSIKGRRIAVNGRMLLGKKVFAEAEGLCISILSRSVF